MSLGVMKMLVVRIAALVLAGLACSAFAASPDCAGVERWATSMAFVHLKNAGLTDNERLDFTKTKTVRLASVDLHQHLQIWKNEFLSSASVSQNRYCQAEVRSRNADDRVVRLRRGW
jgi:hypothetical protein